MASRNTSFLLEYTVYSSRTAVFVRFLILRSGPPPSRAHKPPEDLLRAHERNGAVLLQNAVPTPLGTHEHSRVHFLMLGSGLSPLNRVEAEFIGATRKERPCFAAERGLDRLGHTSLRRVYRGHTKGTAPFCCRMRPVSLGTHEHSRVHFLMLGSGLPPLNRVGAEFIGATRKKRPCFAAERGLDRLGHTSLRRVYWGHTKGMAPFCCRMRPRPLWAHTSTRGSIF